MTDPAGRTKTAGLFAVLEKLDETAELSAVLEKLDDTSCVSAVLEKLDDTSCAVDVVDPSPVESRDKPRAVELGSSSCDAVELKSAVLESNWSAVEPENSDADVADPSVIPVSEPLLLVSSVVIVDPAASAVELASSTIGPVDITNGSLDVNKVSTAVELIASAVELNSLAVDEYINNVEDKRASDVEPVAPAEELSVSFEITVRVELFSTGKLVFAGVLDVALILSIYVMIPPVTNKTTAKAATNHVAFFVLDEGSFRVLRAVDFSGKDAEDPGSWYTTALSVHCIATTKSLKFRTKRDDRKICLLYLD